MRVAWQIWLDRRGRFSPLRLAALALLLLPIANSLGITLDTAKKHVRNVIDKLEAKTRIHAAIIAAQAGIVGNPITHIAQTQLES